MKKFFSIYVLTPWDKLPVDDLTKIRLLSLKSLFKSYPIIESKFFEDLSINLSSQKHYCWYKSIKRIVGPENEEYDIQYWNFIWAMDIEKRFFQLLFQKINLEDDSQRILVALAPPELGKLITQFKKDAILRILSLLNNPKKIKFLIILSPKGKSIAEETQLFRFNKKDINQNQLIDILKKMPNIKGQWFMNYAPRCPICNRLMKELKDYRLGLSKLVCPHCGYKKTK